MILAYLLKQKNLEWAGGHFGGSEGNTTGRCLLKG